MDDYSKKAILTVVLVFWGLFFISFGIMMMFTAKELGIEASFSTPVDIQQVSLEALGDVKAVDTTLQMAFGAFGSESIKTRNRTTHGSATYTDLFYAVPIYIEDEMYYMAVEVADEDKRPYDKLMEVTYQYMRGDEDVLGTYTKSLKGSFIRMDDEIYQKLSDWLWEKGIVTNKEDLDTYVLPYVMKEVDLEVNRQLSYSCIIFFAVGMLVLIAGVIYRNKRFLRKN